MIVEIFHDQSPGKNEVGLGSNSQPLNQQLDSLLIALKGLAFSWTSSQNINIFRLKYVS